MEGTEKSRGEDRQAKRTKKRIMTIATLTLSGFPL